MLVGNKCDDTSNRFIATESAQTVIILNINTEYTSNYFQIIYSPVLRKIPSFDLKNISFTISIFLEGHKYF